MIKAYIVRIDGKDYRVEVEGIEGEEYESTTLESEHIEKRRGVITQKKETPGKPETITAEEKVIYAPMPAKVIKVNCKSGQRVKRGDLLMVIEAMKMENEILSHIDGVIKEVSVVEGMNVSHDDKLVVFE